MNDAPSGARQRRPAEPAEPASAEQAVVLDLDLEWNEVDADPYLLANGRKAFLVMMVNQPPDTEPGPATPGDQFPFLPRPLAVVDFFGFWAVRGFGGPGTGTLATHPLDGKGLVPHHAHQVINSRWITYEERVDPVKPAFTGRPMASLQAHLRHYLFSFSEHTLEFLAEDIAVERRVARPTDTVTELARRLVVT